MEKFFKLKENGTSVGTEVVAGFTTFFAMAYIIVVNPSILSESGMEWGAVFLATIISAVIGTLVMGLVANVPYAQAPGMGLNAFFVYTVCFALEFTWQEALTMVFICGLFNIFITVTKIRKHIIKSIPASLQNAIGGGIGLFVAYIGLLNVGIINFGGGVPALSTLNQPAFWLFLIGLVLIVVLQVLKVKGAILIGIIVTTLIGIPMGVTVTSNTVSFSEACAALPSTFGVIFTSEGFGSLFSDMSRLPLVLITIFSFSLSDTFDTIGTFIGTGRRSGIFSAEDEKALESRRHRHLHRRHLRHLQHHHLRGERRGHRRRRPHRSDQRGRSSVLHRQRLPVHLRQRHSLRRHRSRPGGRGHDDGLLLPGDQVGRLRRGGSRLLRRAVHGSVLQHLLRHRLRLHLLLRCQVLHQAGQGRPPHPLGRHHSLHSQLRPAGRAVSRLKAKEGAWSCLAAPGALFVFLARGLALEFRWRRSARLGRPIFPGKAAAKRQLSAIFARYITVC